MAKVKERVKTTVKEHTAPEVAQAQREGTAVGAIGTASNPSDKVLTLANFVTLCRLALTIAFLVLFIQRQHRFLALSFYTIAAITDFLDGWIARSTNTVSWLGKVMDPVMDRVLLFTGVLGLVVTGDLPLWVAVFVIGRDLILLGGTVYLQQFWRRPIDVIFIGKVATALFMTGFCLLLIGHPQVPGLALFEASWLPGLNDQPASVGIFLVYVAVIFSAITAVTYYREGFAIRDRVLAERAAERLVRAAEGRQEA